MICLNSAGGLARSEVEIGGDDEHLRAMRRASDARRHTWLPNPKRFRAAGCTLHRAVHVTNERRDAFSPPPRKRVGEENVSRSFPAVYSFITGRSSARNCDEKPSALARGWESLRLVCITDPQTDVARAAKARAAMCVRNVDDQGVLQFTLILAAGCVLHRRTSRVIHRQELFQFLIFK